MDSGDNPAVSAATCCGNSPDRAGTGGGGAFRPPGPADAQAAAEPAGPQAQTPESRPTHSEALRSTTIIGGSSAIVMFIRMVRTKVLAVLLGPAGVGLEAIYDSVITLWRSVVDLGTGSSGVRQIAAAVGTGDAQVVARTAHTLRRVCLVLGLLGSAGLFLLREPVSRLAFGNSDYATAIGWLAIVPLLGSLTGGQGALLQGMRRIGELAKLNVFGTLISVVLTIPLVYLWGANAIPAYLILSVAGTIALSWWYVRRIPLEKVHVPLRESFAEAGRLVRLGVVFLASGLMTTGSLFAMRILVTREAGIDGAGEFQAANALSLVYIGFVLQAMGTDFYPRLTAVAGDNARCNQLVNDQTEISILLGLPGILGTITFAPWVIHVFYSDRFGVAADILCWQVAGMLFRLISWPMAFVMVAKGRAAAYFWTDLAAYSLYVLLGWIGLRVAGLPGAGIAFLGMYVGYAALIHRVVRGMSGFRWSPLNVRFGVAGVASAAAVLGLRFLVPDPWATIAAALLTTVVGIFCLTALVRLIGAQEVNRYLAKFRLPFRFPEKSAPAAAGGTGLP